jgi:hypothetical protein
MKFTDKEKARAKQELLDELDKFVTPREIDERIFHHYCENKSEDTIIMYIMQEFDLKECYATKCWWFSTNNRDLLEKAKKANIRLNCLVCTEECVPQKFR